MHGSVSGFGFEVIEDIITAVEWFMVDGPSSRWGLMEFSAAKNMILPIHPVAEKWD
jgi:hypothetical protein